MSGSMSFDYRFQTQRQPSKPREEGERAMRILVLGSFSGTGGTGGLPTRRLARVDVDGFDSLFARLAPRLDLAPSRPEEPALSLALESIEDFHPDRLIERLEIFRALRETRRRLADPATFAEAAGALKAAPPGPAATTPSGESEGETLSRLLGRAPVKPREGPGGRAGANLAELIRGIVQPHIVPGTDPRQESFVASVDAAIGEQMRSVLRRPGLRALEGAWRSLRDLVVGAELSEDVRFWILDATRDEVAADLAAGSDPASSALHRLVLEEGVEAGDGQPWSLLIADWAFGTSEADARLLSSLGALAQRAGAPLLAAAAPEVLGARSLAETPDPKDWAPLEPAAEARWSALRKGPAARWIGLVLPRVMLRLPYGRQTDPTERFAFEELPGTPDPSGYLWGNPAFACAILLARSFEERGGEMEPGDHLQLDGRPAHSWSENGQSRLTPCTEAALSERGAEAVLSRGLIPLLGFPNRNALRVLRFQSLAEPSAPLAGFWS